jgi:hypothetical protein
METIAEKKKNRPRKACRKSRRDLYGRAQRMEQGVRDSSVAFVVSQLSSPCFDDGERKRWSCMVLRRLAQILPALVGQSGKMVIKGHGMEGWPRMALRRHSWMTCVSYGDQLGELCFDAVCIIDQIRAGRNAHEVLAETDGPFKSEILTC